MSARACWLPDVAVVSAVLTAATVLLSAASAEAVAYPTEAFTISPVSAPDACLGMKLGKGLRAMPCDSTKDQQFTYDSENMHLVNGNGECVVAGGVHGVGLGGGPCGGKAALVDPDPMGAPGRQHIKSKAHANAKALCFTLGKNDAVGSFNCGDDPNQEFDLKTAS